MKKGQIMLYITAIVLVSTMLLITILKIIDEVDSVNIGFTNINDLLENSSSNEEVYIDSDVEISTNDNNVFKSNIDLKDYIDNEEIVLEEVSLYPYKDKNEKYGYMDSEGKKIIEAIYDDVYFFQEGLAAVNKDGKYGFIDKNSTEILPFEYVYVLSEGFYNGVAIVVLCNGQYAAINKKGEIIIADNCDYMESYYYGLITVEYGNKTKYYNYNGEEIKLSKGSYLATGFKDRIAEVWDKDYNTYYINEKGDVIKIDKAENYYSFIDGIAEVEIKGKDEPIYINRNFEQISLKDNYSSMSHWSVADNIACVINYDAEDYKMYQYINLEGEKIFSSEYGIVEPFRNGIAPVFYKSGYTFMDSQGNLIDEKVYDSLEYLADDIYSIMKENKVGVINRNGEIKIPIKYDYIHGDKGIIEAWNYEVSAAEYDLYYNNGEKINKDENMIRYHIPIDSKVVYVLEKEDYTNGYYINLDTKEKFNYNQ